MTVGYERIRGLRDIGQRRGGSYEASKSKTIAVPRSTLHRAWSTKQTRDQWLPGVDFTVRTSSKDKSMRLTWPDDTWVLVYFTSKGPSKSQVAVHHTRFPDKKAVTEAKSYWAERIDVLEEVLTTSAA